MVTSVIIGGLRPSSKIFLPLILSLLPDHYRLMF